MRQKGSARLQAWFGGSFDPVHNGHLVAAQEVVEQLQLEYLHFTPCFLSPHKSKTACSNQDRLNMLKLAIENNERFLLDEREVERGGSSRTFETLLELREQYGDACNLIWIVGWDAFLSFHSWYHWQGIGELCNLLVVNRPGYTDKVPEVLSEWLRGREVVKEELHRFNFGKLLFLDTPMIEVSSSSIRERCSRNLSVQYHLPEKVLGYIRENRLFVERR